MRFAYDVSWIALAHLNACILASTTAAERDPGAGTLVSFQYLINELNHCWYTGHTLPIYLQYLLTICAGRRAALEAAVSQPPNAPQIIDVSGRAGGGGGVIVPIGRRWNDCGREVTPNPRPIQRLHILSVENIQGM